MSKLEKSGMKAKILKSALQLFKIVKMNVIVMIYL